MAELGETPRGNRVHIAFFGLRNAGKSTLVNKFTGQEIAIVSDVAGTTTDPVSKAMEILPLGPCLITDTAGLDDTGELGEMRVRKSLAVLATTDVAVWVATEGDETSPHFLRLKGDCERRGVPLLVHRRSESAQSLRERIAGIKVEDVQRGILDGLVAERDHVVCVCPIDESAPKGRLILPQVQVIRECLDLGAVCTVCQPARLRDALDRVGDSGTLVITDSQAFGEVRRALEGSQAKLTSFSILFARQKGDLAQYLAGVAAARSLKDGDRVLVAEGCTHHRQCGDIGTVKIPRALEKLSGAKPEFTFASGSSFGVGADCGFALVVHCGGCMLTRREVMGRIAACREASVPIVNYGMLLAAASGMDGIRPDGLVER